MTEIKTFDQLYLHIAQLAKANGNEKLLKACIRNQARIMKKRVTATVTR